MPISEPDAAGIIQATLESDVVQVFRRDLEEGCERIEIETAASASA